MNSGILDLDEHRELKDRTVMTLRRACWRGRTTLDQVLDGLGADWRMRARLDASRGPGRRDSFSPHVGDIERVGYSLGLDPGDLLLEVCQDWPSAF